MFLVYCFVLACDRTAITLCLFLAILFLTIGSAAAADTIEKRGPVYDGTNIETILGANGGITMDASNFATIYYDIDPKVTTETLTLK